MSIRKFLLSLIAAGAAASVHGQTMIGFQPRQSAASGGHFRLQSVSAILEYSSGRDPFLPSAQAARDRRFGGGANATLGFFRAGERSQLSWAFTSSYVEQTHSAELNAWTTTMSLGWTRRLTPTVALSVGGAGALGSSTDMLFMPTSSMLLANAPGTSEELASAVLTGSSNNPVLGRLVRAGSSVNPQSLSLLYGRTALGLDGQITLDYSYSPRLSLRWRVGGTRTQPWRPNVGSVAVQHLFSQSSTGFADMGAKYALSPRTQLGFGVSAQRAYSRIQDSYSSSAMLSIGRTMTRRWFVALFGGVGAITPVRSQELTGTTSTRVRASYQAAGSLGYRNLSHTILFNASRLVSDSYGLGATATTSSGFSWVRQRAGSVWWSGIDLSYNRLSDAFNVATGERSSLEARTVTPMIGRKISAGTAVQLQYLFTYFSRPIVTPSGSNKYQHAARLSLVWIPGAAGR